MDKQEKEDVTPDQGLSGKELYEIKKQERDAEKKKEHKGEVVKVAPKKMVGPIIFLLLFAGFIAWFIWFAGQQLYLPPVTSQGHSESIPDAHIIDTPLSDGVQRHMLEHSDGAGRPGIIIQYNCDDYDCASDLVGNLTTLVEEFPENVYLAPNNYDAKIILTRNGTYEILEAFDEEAIRGFIR